MTAFLGVAGGIAAPEFQPSSDRRHDLDPPYERSSDAAERVHGAIKEATQSQIWLKASTDKIW